MSNNWGHTCIHAQTLWMYVNLYIYFIRIIHNYTLDFINFKYKFTFKDLTSTNLYRPATGLSG